MRRLNLNTDGGIFEGSIDLLVEDKDVLDKMLDNLRRIKGIQSVMRTDI